jgi:hypothetical protein
MLAGSWLAASGCTDDGMVGKLAECLPACEGDETCDPLRGMCVECEDEASCEELADECDDCAAGDALCIAMLCTSCTTSAACPRDEPLCSNGRCVELEDARGDLNDG